VKFTDSGSVSIVLNARFEQGNNQGKPSAILEVTVSDTGPGIAEEDLNFIFEEFRQFEAGHQKGGTGLGMPICKRLTDLLGGSLEVSSQLDLGTVVKFEIPVEVAEEFIEEDNGKDSTRILPLSGTALKILIVDDQLENQLLLWYMLKDAGFDIKKVSSGKEALDIIENWTPDCALLDIRMPDMNGLELTKALRNNPKTASIKIIAISASSYNFGPNMYEETGLDDFIVKPVIQDGLLKILEKNLSIKFPDKKKKSGQFKMPTTNSKLGKYFSEVSNSDKTNLINLIRSGDVDMFQEYTTNSSTLSGEVKIELLKLLDLYEFDKIIHLLEMNHDG
jgi:CheY-like chemotaxis protein